MSLYKTIKDFENAYDNLLEKIQEVAEEKIKRDEFYTEVRKLTQNPRYVGILKGMAQHHQVSDSEVLELWKILAKHGFPEKKGLLREAVEYAEKCPRLSTVTNWLRAEIQYRNITESWDEVSDFNSV